MHAKINRRFNLLSLPLLSYQKRILIMLILVLVLICLYLFWGLTPKNTGFILPRRLTKILAIVVVSYCIGQSSVIFQTITNNNILTPSVMGLDSLYLFIQTAVVYFFGTRQLQMMTGLPNFFLSVGVMVAASWLLYYLLFHRESKNLYLLVLSGMVIGQLFGGMATFMQVLLDPNEFATFQGKMFASFSNVNSSLLMICIAVAGVILLLSLPKMRELDALSLGPDHAINLGVNYSHLVKLMLMSIAVMISVATVLVGPVTFLGILVVSLARKLLVTYHHTYRIAGATILGILFLLTGMILVERVFAFETTVGVIVNFIGGAYFLYLMVKERSI